MHPLDLSTSTITIDKEKLKIVNSRVAPLYLQKLIILPLHLLKLAV